MGIEYERERERVERGMKQAGVTELNSKGCSRWKRSEHYKIPPALLKKNELTSKPILILTILVFLTTESVVCCIPCNLSSQIQPALTGQLVQIVRVSLRLKVPLSSCSCFPPDEKKK